MRTALKIHETTAADGSLSETFLVKSADTLAVVVGEEPARELPDGAIEAVMKRYGSDLDNRERLVDVGALDLDEAGHRIRHVRHLGFYDVIARDYLVYEAPDAAPVFAMAITVAGALAHLSKAGGAAP